ncbi:MAG: hypothetical protein Q8K63_09130, partial [Acidimicrobiales bacterium]|nr:hypothetical protein [Acidimicrobiales bacterium]
MSDPSPEVGGEGAQHIFDLRGDRSENADGVVGDLPVNEDLAAHDAYLRGYHYFHAHFWVRPNGTNGQGEALCVDAWWRDADTAPEVLGVSDVAECDRRFIELKTVEGHRDGPV